jgi:NAD(P)-dependent dehydrogenase (short-subunit alcohol dehydrogenase family)
MADLTGKVAVITGASSGIGLATVEGFVAKGANVVAADLQIEQGEALQERFGADRVRFIACDVTNDEELKAAIDLAPDAFGGLDIMFNNAGAGGTTTTAETLDLEAYDKTMDLLLRSASSSIHPRAQRVRQAGRP